MAELLALSSLTADVSKAAYLERMLDNNAASYKYYWFKGILGEVCAGHESMTFTRLVARMAAGAWYPVVFFRLHLGASDKLSDLIDYLRSRYQLPRDAKANEVIAAVEENVVGDTTLAKLVADRTHNVPYRIIRPFYEVDLRTRRDALVGSGIRWYDTMTDNVIFELNQTAPDSAIYAIHPKRDALTVSPAWVSFLRDNELIIRGWLDFRLTQYLQSRNPSVPAISSKLRAPVKRDLAAADRYWKCAMELVALADIYTRQRFTQDNFATLGSWSIDHFIPWSFVLHDEAWDLIPMFKNVNSSKSDNLPALETYLDPFCTQQFDAYIAIKQAGLAGKHAKQIASYRSIDAHLDDYTDSDASRTAFAESMRNAVVPLYQIALNQGYMQWEYQAIHHEGDIAHQVIALP